MALICGHLTRQCVRGLGGEIAKTPDRSCVPPSTIWSAGDSCWGGAFMRPLFWCRRCWTTGADGDVTEVEAAIEGSGRALEHATLGADDLRCRGRGRA
jgi:hypothetical protein